MPAPESWRDWLPEGAPAPEVITRAELLATAERLGIDVDERTLRYWESRDILPRPEYDRIRFGGELTWYPRWWVQLLWHLRQYQDEGYKLAQLPPLLKAQAHRLAFPLDALYQPRLDTEVAGRTVADSAYAAYWAEVSMEMAEDHRAHPGVPAELEQQLVADLHRLAWALQRGGARPTATAQLRLLAVDGEETHKLSVSLYPAPDAPS